MDMQWITLLALLVSVTIILINALFLLIILTDVYCQSTSNFLSGNMWISNCIFGIVGIFFYMSCNINSLQGIDLRAIPMSYSTTKYNVVIERKLPRSVDFSHIFDDQYYTNKPTIVMPQLVNSPELNRFAILAKNLMEKDEIRSTIINQSNDPDIGSTNYNVIFAALLLAALVNSTVTLMTLLSVAFVQIFLQHHSNNKMMFRISCLIWTFMLIILSADYIIINGTRSISLVMAFQIALMCIILMFNLTLHPVNLIRSERKSALTETLWLAIHSLSFIVLVTLFVWSNLPQYSPFVKIATENQNNNENKKLFILQVTAYGLHCIANPIVALQRDPNIMNAIISVLCKKVDNQNVQEIVYAEQSQNIQHSLNLCMPPPPYKEISTRSSAAVNHRTVVNLCLTAEQSNV